MPSREDTTLNVHSSFFNLYTHNFARVAVAIPEVHVADPAVHAESVIEMMEEACSQRALLILFPELGLSAYSCEDLFHQQALLRGCLDALQSILHATTALPITAVIGIPLVFRHQLYNCAVVIHEGQILGVTPKTYLPNYREFYELRQFTPAEHATFSKVSLCGQDDIPFGTDLIFQLRDQPLFSFHAEICEDVWVPIPPSCYAALAGATVLLNLSASNITIGKAEYRQQLVSNQSARCLSAYLYSAAGTGESTTDLAWDGHALIYENGHQLAESDRFSYEPQLIYGDIDLERLSQERMRQGSFSQNARTHAETIKSFRTIQYSSQLPRGTQLLLSREYERFPYVPSNPHIRDKRCFEAYQIQVQGLVKRMKAARIKKAIIGVSGGLDSTHALIVTARAMDLLGYPRENILAYTMPGFATSSRTLEQAHALMKSIGCHAEELDIRPSCMQMLKDIGHPYAEGEEVYDITFENVQAGERTSHLFRLANLHGGMVIGTGDLSELALGWCTYGVGDHMSHYAVNASVPKTLIQYLIRWIAETGQMGIESSRVLKQILDTEISPELIPSSQEGDNEPQQKTEDSIGPYELQDFHLYYTLRFGYTPPRIAFIAYNAWHNKHKGTWPSIPKDRRNEYTIADIKTHLRTFVHRFFQISQFKRSCIPNGPKVGSGGSLSPRGDYRAPSDGESAAWKRMIAEIPDDLDA
ncbi:MAG: NAD(+) synthase [Deltaproteobacteria bacterium]|nr:NAD(+) synthase [Deltaproteobacteria bacterium]MBU50936.1 NAD(+) synthase [Deltaproteobacteria bacterium]|tara:strand:- start:6358 stop:8457 length:2100 start_codon:yes stop_codon:yes gene_type:complete